MLNPGAQTYSDLNARVDVSKAPYLQRSIKVLIVTDQTILREGLVTLLEKFDNIRVVGHSNHVLQGLQILEDVDCDVVLTDVGMKNSCPFELCEKTKTLNPRVKVLFLFDKLSEKYLQRSLEAGATGFVSKVESTSSLISAIRDVYDGLNYFSTHIGHRNLSPVHSVSQ